MTDRRQEGPGERSGPIPRDMPDQQAGEEEDPWDARPGRGSGKNAEDERADDVPDTDEAGTGRRGGPRSGTIHPDHPEPDEPSG
ncbi:hypothetical protein ACFTY7_03910 [Streptomyces sp. NPDC057062]|uniref:hypothetical protein n=1 Tax=unclassified Streptomyces TaxID=2593676 RepID=UPI001C6DE34D|nr:hypothetical protein [Streptomyces sp. MBT84]